jgi:hypothetical protein
MTRKGMAIAALSGVPARVMLTTIAKTASPRAMAFRIRFVEGEPGRFWILNFRLPIFDCGFLIRNSPSEFVNP